MPQDTLIESGFARPTQAHEDEECAFLLWAFIDFSFSPLRASFSNFSVSFGRGLDSSPPVR